MQHWSTIAAIPGQPTLANGSAIPVDRLITGSFDFNALNQGYVRQSPAASVLPGSTQNPYNPHQTLGYHFHPSLSVGTPQSVEPAISARQFQNATLNASYQSQHFQQPGSASQQITLPHAPVYYGQSLPYLPSLVTAMGNGGLGHGHQYANMQMQHTVAIANTVSSLKHFGNIHQNQHIRRNKPMITSKTNLYISGLNESDTDDTVRALVENVVQPKSCKAMLTNGKCKGSGFIDCTTEEDAEKAKAHILECAKATGRKLSVKYAFENEKDTLNVYVRNLPRMGFTEEMLEELFRFYGNVTSVKLHETDAGLTGIGFVRFATAEEAEKAVEHMNESKRIVGDSDKPITCKLADKAGPRSRPPGNNPQVHAAQAAVVAAATGLHHQSQISIGNHLVRAGSGLPNPSIQALGHLQHQSTAYAPQFQLPTQLVQPLQQPSVVVPNMHHSSHTRSVLLPQALLPNGASGTPSMLPVSFAAIGGLNGGTTGSGVQASGSNANSYRTTFIGQPPNPMPPNQIAVFATPAVLDSNSNRLKTQPGNFANSAATTYVSGGPAVQSTQNVFPSSTTHSEPVTSTFQTVLSYVQQQPSPQSSQTTLNDSQPVILPHGRVYRPQSIQSTPSTSPSQTQNTQEMVNSLMAPEFQAMNFNSSVGESLSAVGHSKNKSDIAVAGDSPGWSKITNQPMNLTIKHTQTTICEPTTTISLEANDEMGRYFVSVQDSHPTCSLEQDCNKSDQGTVPSSGVSVQCIPSSEYKQVQTADNPSVSESSPRVPQSDFNCSPVEGDKADMLAQKKSKAAELKHDPSSSSVSRRSEMGSSEAQNVSLNRRKKNSFSTTTASHKQQTYTSVVDTRTSANPKDLNTTSEIHISAGCKMLNPTPP